VRIDPAHVAGRTSSPTAVARAPAAFIDDGKSLQTQRREFFGANWITGDQQVERFRRSTKAACA